MKPVSIVKHEMLERKHQLFTSFFTIVIGISAIVSINNITHFSEQAISDELSRLGANVLILPKSATVDNYFTADMGTEFLSEEYVGKLLNSSIHGMDNLSPKLSESITINETKFILTGILPKNEMKSKPVWQSGFSLASPAAQPECTPLDTEGATREQLLAQKRIVDELGSDELFIGYEAADRLSLTIGDKLSVMDREFTIAAVLPAAGSVDDSRLFAHLDTVQEMTGKQGMVSVIEVVGCCKQIFDGLAGKINKLLPDAKVVTINQVVSTQRKTNLMMVKLSRAFLILIVLVGGGSIANYMYSNVYERHQEIGALMALGADSAFVSKLFLMKGAILGFTGGIAGYAVGTVLAMALGPKIAGIPVSPLPTLIPLAVVVSLGVALVATWFPARKAAQVDPCIAFRDI